MRVTITVVTFAGETKFEKIWPTSTRLIDPDDSPAEVRAIINATTAQALLAYPDGNNA